MSHLSFEFVFFMSHCYLLVWIHLFPRFFQVISTINNEVVRSEMRAAHHTPRQRRMAGLHALLRDWAEQMTRGQRTVMEYLAAARHHILSRETLDADLPEDEFLGEEPPELPGAPFADVSKPITSDGQRVKTETCTVHTSPIPLFVLSKRRPPSPLANLAVLFGFLRF